MPESIVENNPKSVEQEEQNNVSTRTYSINEFADVIKKKYPEYKDIEDTELTTLVLNKYPEDAVGIQCNSDEVIVDCDNRDDYFSIKKKLLNNVQT